LLPSVVATLLQNGGDCKLQRREAATAERQVLADGRPSHADDDRLESLTLPTLKRQWPVCDELLSLICPDRVPAIDPLQPQAQASCASA
jgi:hypothetical protein